MVVHDGGEHDRYESDPGSRGHAGTSADRADEEHAYTQRRPTLPGGAARHGSMKINSLMALVSSLI
ncbi:hypothetical protein KGQ20_26000 [Catenulispora sp. NF23]|uniref:Uncharacterized protein n=1 Tax=Catenulispora pinistramenti TaxID=2705254 RepID=A0ABS5KWD4_9ACTN|nr:hypothetical protein [Catenulispora pinistramenti]MBS2536221.1 hypothetical protein [Catenulispora pinistramenti]MBS2550275.1 hypothetical protein [Catenulispora pinistramenti]